MKPFLILIFLPFAALAQTEPKEFKLKGQLQMARPVDWVYLNYVSGGERVIDSVQPTNGNFLIAGKIAEPVVSSFVVKYAQQPGEARAKREGMQIFLEPATMQISAKDSLKENTVTGSGSHTRFLELNKKSEAFNTRLNKLYEEYSAQMKLQNKEAVDRIEKDIEAVQKDMDENVYASFARANTASPVGLYALKQYAGWDLNPDKVEPLFNALSAEIKNLPGAVAFRDQIEIAKKTAIGREAMDFTQEDTLGRPVSLSSFRGKYVLVDFWASWCKPCREEGPTLVKAYEQYRSKGLEILGVSFDTKQYCE